MYASKCWNTSRSPVDLLVKWVRNVLPLQMAFDWFVGGCLGSFPWSICGHHFSGVEHRSFSISTLKPLNHTSYDMEWRCQDVWIWVIPCPPKKPSKIYLESLTLTINLFEFLFFQPTERHYSDWGFWQKIFLRSHMRCHFERNDIQTSEILLIFTALFFFGTFVW